MHPARYRQVSNISCLLKASIRLFSLGTHDLWGRASLCGRCYRLMLWRTYSSVPGLSPLDATSSILFAMIMKNISRHYQLFLRGQLGKIKKNGG